MSHLPPAGAGSFRLVSTALIYDGAVFRLADETFSSPSGEIFRRQIVRHNGAVAVVPLHDDGTVTVVSQFRASVMGRLLEIPAGLLDRHGEPLDEAARRELREEVGLMCGRLDHLCTYVPAPGMTDERVTSIARNYLEKLFPELQGQCDLELATRWPIGIPFPEPGVYREVHKLKQQLSANDRIQYAGDYFTCTGQNSAIYYGRLAAENILRFDR